MNDTMKNIDPLTIKEAAKALKMSPQWVWAKVHDDKIRHIRKGSKIFIPMEEINRINTEGCE